MKTGLFLLTLWRAAVTAVAGGATSASADTFDFNSAISPPGDALRRHVTLTAVNATAITQ